MSRTHLHLTFPQHLIDEPLLYRLGRDFDLVPTILRANVDDQFAWAIVALEGTEDQVTAGRAWLADQGVEIKELEGGP